MSSEKVYKTYRTCADPILSTSSNDTNSTTLYVNKNSTKCIKTIDDNQAEENDYKYQCLEGKISEFKIQNEILKNHVEFLTKQLYEKEEEIGQMRHDFKQKENEYQQKIDQLNNDLMSTKLCNQKLQERIIRMEGEIADEKCLNQQLRQNQADLRKHLEQRDKKINDMQEQLNDIMLHLSGEQELKKLNIDEELGASTISVVSSEKKNQRKQKRRKSTENVIDIAEKDLTETETDHAVGPSPFFILMRVVIYGVQTARQKSLVNRVGQRLIRSRPYMIVFGNKTNGTAAIDTTHIPRNTTTTPQTGLNHLLFHRNLTVKPNFKMIEPIEEQVLAANDLTSTIQDRRASKVYINRDLINVKEFTKRMSTTNENSTDNELHVLNTNY
ncbi:hypothetical protein I4U23_028474 [Adineta vaga]|nr:hypothetical protein I4U23_028474 [Adineta vaga]